MLKEYKVEAYTHAKYNIKIKYSLSGSPVLTLLLDVTISSCSPLSQLYGENSSYMIMYFTFAFFRQSERIIAIQDILLQVPRATGKLFSGTSVVLT